MLLSTGGQPPLPRPSVATIGFFDGVHLGHRYLIDQVCEAAGRRGLASTVVTFPVHPRRVMQSTFQPRLLLSSEEKVERLALTGIDHCLLLDFTPELALLTARQFMQLLRDRHQVRALVIGHDHRFGHDRLEGLADYIRHGQELGMEVIPALPLATKTDTDMDANASADAEANINTVGGHATTVSSSLIRRLLEEGDVRIAARHLGYDYFLTGAVVDGHHIGRTLGYPTANLQLTCPDRMVPADGVYAVRVHLGPTADGPTYGGMMNIGHRPTVGNGPDRSLEVHVLGLHADLYSHAMRVTFVDRIRPEQRFDSLEQLAAQLHKDELAARSLLGL